VNKKFAENAPKFTLDNVSVATIVPLPTGTRESGKNLKIVSSIK